MSVVLEEREREGSPKLGEDGPVDLTARPVRFHGSRLARALLRGAGWTVRFDGLPSRQGVIVAYPHTSNWDFVVGVLAKWAIGIDIRFWGKDSLFRWPVFGRWLRRIGGVPVDRSSPRGVVSDMVLQIEAAREAGETFWLALAPEGTRKLTEGWRSGFYRVARDAAVPLGIAFFDFERKRVVIESFLMLTGDPARDMPAIAARLTEAHGCRPDQASPIRLL